MGIKDLLFVLLLLGIFAVVVWSVVELVVRENEQMVDQNLHWHAEKIQLQLKEQYYPEHQNFGEISLRPRGSKAKVEITYDDTRKVYEFDAWLLDGSTSADPIYGFRLIE